MTHRTLDWRPRHDPRSRSYPIRPLIAARRPRSYTWPLWTWLDQRAEGACVGFAWGHELAAAPVAIPVTEDDARALYRRAQQLDPWQGEDYEGTSVLAGAKAVQEAGLMGEYRWAFGAQDVIDTVGAYGPTVLGVPWHDSMFDTDADGWLRLDGRIVGGHAILCRGVNLAGRYVTLHNSWGPSWGRNGTARLSFEDLATLLADQGEACVPVSRRP